MTILCIRTILIYTLLLLAMRLMGKRQIGELGFSDFVTTLLISEIASLPITDSSIPLSHAIVPIALVVTFEVLSSALIAKSPKLKNLTTARPATLIRDGKICDKEMQRSRLSTDELISELRQKDICDISEVQYAILEQNGKISVISKAKHRPPTAEQLNLHIEDEGLYHIIIDKGQINRHALKDLQLDRNELLQELTEKNLCPKDIYLMMINDMGKRTIIKKNQV